MVPAYCTLGFAVPASIEKPAMAMSWKPNMKMPRLRTRSAYQLAAIVKKQAQT